MIRLSSLDRDEDDVYDMIKMKRDNSHYIQLVAEPFQVHLFSLEQLKIVLAETKVCKEKPVLHFDATGSIFKIPSSVDKACYYYAGVINIPSIRRICPVFEMVSCKHDTTTIGFMLANFKYYVLEHKIKWPIFEHVVTDFSLALINAVSYFWNCMSLEAYISKTYLYITGDCKLEINILHICCAHFMKIISNDVNKSRVSKEKHGILKEILAAPFNMTSYSAVKNGLNR